MKTARRTVCGIVAILAILSLCAQGLAENEYQVKAAFIIQFTKFIDWPDDAFKGDSEPFVIGIVGNDPFGSTMDNVAARQKAEGRSIVVKRFKADQDFTRCQVLYVGSNPKAVFKKLRDANSKCLTIGDSSDFVSSGGAIGFLLDQNRIRFDINLSAAKNAKLTVSSKLLSLARSVK